MATFLLQDRRHHEQQTPIPDIHSSTPIISAGDHRYRIPTIGLNPGHLPGTRPDQTIRTLCYNPFQNG